MKIAFVMLNLLSTERMSLMLLSALAKKHFPYSERDIFVYTDGKLEEQIKEFGPDVVAFSTMTGEHVHYMKISSAIKTWEKQIGKKMFKIMGGPHCTFAPDILRDSNLDAIGVGECDDAWVELLAALEAGRSPDNIPNIVTQENFSRVVVPANLIGEDYVNWRATNMRPRTCRDPVNHKNCLDHLPFLDWELYLNRTDFEKTNGVLKRTIMTRRGCPFRCTYCFNRVIGALYGGGAMSIHNYSVDRIMEECEYVGRNWPTQFWKIYDDVAFFSSTGREGERLREFAEKWQKRIKLPFFILTRADLVARCPNMLTILKRAGCASLTMSIESGSEYVRKQILERGPMSDKDIIFAHRRAWELGIKTFSNVIFSIPLRPEEIRTNELPRKSIDRDTQSVKLAADSRVHLLECPMLYPYPATKLGRYCRDSGFFDGDISKLPQSYQNLSPFSCFSPREKRMSQNLALLAVWCVYFASRKNYLVRQIWAPVFFGLVTKILIRLPWLFCTKVYFLLYSILQQWLCVSEIYRPKHRLPLEALGKGFWGRLRYEYDKQFPKH